MNGITPEIERLLSKYGFDNRLFESQRKSLQEAGFDPAEAVVQGRVEISPKRLFNKLPTSGDADFEETMDVGKRAIEAGQVGAVMLNGGMATRFGGNAKGVSEAVDGRTFLDLKIRQVEIVGKGAAPVMLMNSFATDDATAEYLGRREFECKVKSFSQFVSIRLKPNGDPFVDQSGDFSLYAPGHGDLPFAIVQSGEIDRFVSDGGRWLVVSNVDNLGASLDPVIVGSHIKAGRSMTVELAEIHPGDMGGFPALVDGKIAILEAFRIPQSFDSSGIFVINTNTFVFDVETLQGVQGLDWFAVKKIVDDREVIQFERLLGQMTEKVDVTWLLVPRVGEKSRFVPIKVPEDLERQQDQLRAVLREQGVL